MHNIYPFAVARNQDIDWTPILLPQLLIDAEVGYSLVLDTDDAEVDTVVQKKWTDPMGNAWMMIYRRKLLMDYHVGEDGAGEQMTDRFGRYLSFVEGGFIYTQKQLQEHKAKQILDAIEKDIQPIMAEFWVSDDYEFRPAPSTPQLHSLINTAQLEGLFTRIREGARTVTSAMKGAKEVLRRRAGSGGSPATVSASGYESISE